MILNRLDDGISGLQEFRRERGLPVWRYPAAKRRIAMLRGRNATVVSWRARERMTVTVRPWFQFRAHGGAVDLPASDLSAAVDGRRCTVGIAHLTASAGEWRTIDPRTERVRYETERQLGYDCEGPLTCPCELTLKLQAREEAHLAIALEPIDPRAALNGELARRERLTEEQIATELFLTDKPAIVAGYPWFTDWGRDTFISLEGLCLRTGRSEQAARILRRYGGFVRDGLVPNHFPEGSQEAVYNTADASLWFFHAVDRYTTLTGDGSVLRELLPVLKEIVEKHLHGTRFGIGVDPRDGLLTQGEPGLQLTWMDAKVGDEVVTPRRGKAVEINALFYNALRLFDAWTGDRLARAAAERLRASFNARFVLQDRLYDVLDPDDAALRPNQLFAISLPHPVLDRSRWEPVLRTLRDELLTPFGLRTLGPREPGYQPRYEGDLRSRDRAYHQGTVWPWLIGPFIDAWTKVFPQHDPRPLLAPLEAYLRENGSVSEIFDAEPPHAPRGCVAQAWSVAEVLRLRR